VEQLEDQVYRCDIEEAVRRVVEEEKVEKVEKVEKEAKDKKGKGGVKVKMVAQQRKYRKAFRDNLAKEDKVRKGASKRERYSLGLKIPLE